MTRQYYPLALDLEGKRCLVAGGGKIATEKIEGLLFVGAEVVVVSPSVLPRVVELAAAGRITYHARQYCPDDLAGVYLAYGATDDLQVNAGVTADARALGILVNAVDDPPNCDFFAMAVVRRGDLQVSISTNGHSPAFARWLREHLDESLPREYEDLVAVLSDVRREIRQHGKIPPYEYWQAAITDDVLLRLQEGDREGARAAIWETVSAAQDHTGPGPARWERSA